MGLSGKAPKVPKNYHLRGFLLEFASGCCFLYGNGEWLKIKLSHV